MFFRDFRRWLRGAPDSALTIYLILVAILATIVALFGPPELKLGVLVWLVAP